MNEAETRAELIDPRLKACGWGVVEDSKILRERDVCKITDGRIQAGGGRSKPLIADYILVYKGIKLAVVEAKSSDLEVGEGMAQAKLYAGKLKLETTYSTNGKEIYQICIKTGTEGLVKDFFLLKSFGIKHTLIKMSGGINLLLFLLKIKAVHGNCAIIRRLQ
jgi:type I restriction enzyme, R subunit